MKQLLAVAVIAMSVNIVHAADQPPVRYTVEVKKGGTIVECPSVEGALGQAVRITLSIGRTVVGLAQPLDSDGRSKVTIQFEAPPLSAGTLESAREMTNTFKLTQSSPTFQYAARDAERIAYTVLVTSPPLLATTRAEPDWRKHLDKLTPVRQMQSGECKAILG
jgi:hypothetical protein